MIYLYILAVFPSSSGIAISGAVAGYVTAICHSKITKPSHRGYIRCTYENIICAVKLKKLHV